VAKTKAKTTTKTTRSARENILKVSQLQNFRFTNSYTSLLYGIITVFVLFLIIVFGVRVISNRDQGEITKEAPKISQEQNSQATGYRVQEGDTLWSIAETQLGDGFAWREIAKLNNIKGDAVEKGMNLRLPEKKSDVMIAQTTAVTPTATGTVVTVTVQPTQKVVPTTPNTKAPEQKGGQMSEMTQQPSMTAISGTKYTVARGDNLWNISVRAYGNGFAWGEIAQANNLSNPSIIHAGNVLNLPR